MSKKARESGAATLGEHRGSDEIGCGGISRRAFLASGGAALLGGAAFLSGGALLGNMTLPDDARASGIFGGLLGGLKSGSVVSKATVEEYTWDELAAVADLITASGSEEAAIEVAKQYNLCTSEGKLDGTQVKSVPLSDGVQAQAQIVGFYHDDRSDRFGKAGITFIFTGAVAECAMCERDSSYGGWQGSDVRKWLSGDFLAMLPTDLIARIVAVSKASSAYDLISGEASTFSTDDTVWIFSAAELFGPIRTWQGDYSRYNDAYNAEGLQYQLFANMGILGQAYNPILIKSYLPATSSSGNWTQNGPCAWWMRSVRPEDTEYTSFDCTSTKGGMNWNLSSAADGVVPGFCIGGSVTGSTVQANVAVKSSVEEYTWDELSAIAGEISQATNRYCALQTAQKYGLCQPGGTFDGTQSKSLVLSDGLQTAVQLVDVYHDYRSGVPGKAGITFAFAGAVAEHVMNSSGTKVGGWEASEMRGWLANDFMAMLPADLAAYIVTVEKLTNNTGETEDVSAVTTTQDTVWLFSPMELSGAIGWYLGDYGPENEVLAIEGDAYPYFEAGFDAQYIDNWTLRETYLPGTSASGSWVTGQNCDWWTRSPYPCGADGSTGFNAISSEGDPDIGDDASLALGVVPGFCL